MFQLRAAYVPPILAPTRVGAAVAACCGEPANTNAILRVGWAPDPNTYDLHHANASRFGARKELLLLEDHLTHEKCPECVYKHLDRAIAFLEEARALDEGNERDIALANRLSALSSTIGNAATEIRLVRREIGAMLGRGGKAQRSLEVSGVGVGAALTKAWTDDDFRTLTEIANKYRILDPAFIANVMMSESGLLPWAANKNSAGYPVAVGLIQLTKVTNSVTGITEEQRIDVPNWSVSEQLPLIDKVFAAIPWTRAGRDYDSPASVYEAIFAPGRMLSRGTSYDTVLYDSSVPEEVAAYNGNKGLDNSTEPERVAARARGEGYITVGDLARRLELVAEFPMYKEAVERLRAVGGTFSSSETPWWHWAALGVFTAAVGIFFVAR